MVVRFLKEHKWIILAMVVALIVRIILIISNPRGSIQEDWELESLSQNLFHGLGYKYSNVDTGGALVDYWIYPPGISVLYSFIYFLIGINEYSFTGLRVFQSVIDTFGCVAVYVIGNELFSKRVGIVSSYLYALFIPIAFMSTFAAHDALVPYFCAVILSLFVLGIKRNKVGYFIMSGIACGVSTYFQPVTIMLPVALGFCSFVYYIGKESFWVLVLHAVKRTVILFLVMFLIMTPYIVRSASLSGTVNPMRSTAWATPYLGWGEDPNNEFGISMVDRTELEKASKELGHTLIFGSAEYEEYYKSKVIHIITEHPDFVVSNIIRRIPLTLVYPSDLGFSYPKEDDGTPLSQAKPLPEQYLAEHPSMTTTMKMIGNGSIMEFITKYTPKIFELSLVFLFAILPLSLSVIGVYLRKDKWREFALISVLPIYFSLVSLLIVSVASRAKLPECPSYFVMGAVAICCVYSMIKNKRLTTR